MLKLWLHVEMVETAGETAEGDEEPVELAVIEDGAALGALIDHLLRLCEEFQSGRDCTRAGAQDEPMTGLEDEAS